MKRGHEDSKKTRHGHVWGQISLKVDFRFFVKLGLYFVLYHVDQPWANRRSTGRSPTVRQSIANIFNSKKFIKI